MDLSHLSRLVCSHIDQIRHKNELICDDGSVQTPGINIFIRDVQPYSQNGPQCGLVALYMASTMLGYPQSSVDDIFARANQNGFTKQGEMFSSDWLATTFNDVFNCSSASVSGFPVISKLVNSLLKDDTFVVPYDCDRNFQPTNKNGHTAHWAIIIGYLSVTFNHDEVKFTNEFPTDLDDRNFYVIAYQGKSKHMGIWSYLSLMESNSQLNEIGPNRGAEDFVIPEGGNPLLKETVVHIKARQQQSMI